MQRKESNNMTLESKKELLQYKVLVFQNCDIYMYRVLEIGYLNNIIEKVNPLSIFYENVDVQDNEIKASQFLELLEKFIHIIRSSFFNITTTEFIIGLIIKDNIQQLDKFLSIKKDTEEYENIILENAYKIIFSNFIKNGKYIPSVETFLNENNLKLKSINEYSFEESKKILFLLSDLVFSQRGRGKLTYLFENLESHVTTRIKSYENRRNKRTKKYTPEFFWEEDTKSFNSYYESIFKSYNIRKKYLKYFK